MSTAIEPGLPAFGPVGDGITAARAGWTFGGRTPEHFAQHVARSVPYYHDGHDVVERLSDFFVKPDSAAYEIGTSVGTLVRRLAQRHSGTRWVGLDVEPAMIAKARAEHDAAGGPPGVEYALGDACDFAFTPCDFVVAYYTVQFVPPRRRQVLIDNVFRSLNWGGAFLLFEKVRAPDARFQDIASSLYEDYKTENGYSPQEIVEKARSLRGVLEPFSTQGNLDMLARAGFVDTMTVFKYVCFEGILAIK